MSGRQGGGRRGGRDTSRDNDLELEYLNSVLESLRKAKEYNDESSRLGQEILALEEEIKTNSSHKSGSASRPEQHRKLDDLYRKKLRNAEAEKKVHDDEDIVNKLAILASLRSNDEPAPTRGAGPKGRTKSSYQQRPIIESDISADGSAAVSPAETTASTNPRVDVLKRKQLSNTPRGSTPVVGRPPGSATAKELAAKDSTKDGTAAMSEADRDLHKGIQAERAGLLAIGTEVFYKYSKTVPDDVGVGIQCIIKKIHPDRKPIIYDVQDPEPDPSGKISVHKATAKDLYPIPPASGTGALGADGKGTVFQPGTTVYARYPDTDTFYRAKVVRGLKGGEYTLRFEGEEDDTEKGVERRFVLDTRMR
ncbi:hypothetical protein PMZ80_003888 [Knufia obscura]|uniref:SGF29 C-terminal domain-containing protein n=2 Tax=Knufia TaxID=430999 RepID=A0AAN8ET49_9EURO|nr:hypothetical protein PMZ80_003888 [Knufia obscura]KAK5958197.1 hypothetical protein OHC33_000038 [Knufia fluminis]